MGLSMASLSIEDDTRLTRTPQIQDPTSLPRHQPDEWHEIVCIPPDRANTAEQLLTVPRSAIMAGAFGVTAGIFALLFFDEVPRVRQDILRKVPIIGNYFVREVPPEDDPF